MVDPLEFICSAVAGGIINQMVSPLTEKYRRQNNIEENLHKLRQLLIAIHAALEAAEGRAITNTWLLCWIRKFEDAACEGGRVTGDITPISTEATIRLADTVKKVQKVADGTAKFIELLKFECDMAVVHRPIIISVSTFHA